MRESVTTKYKNHLSERAARCCNCTNTYPNAAAHCLGFIRVSRNLEKNWPEAPQAPKFFEICHSPLHLPPRGTHSTHVPDKLGTVHMAPGLAPGHFRWTQTVLDLNCLAIFGPSPPQPRRAARRAHSSGPTLVPSPAAPAPRSLNSVLRHAGSQSTVMVW